MSRVVNRKRERYTALINNLERTLFPHQESEEEQESFTDNGRQRVDEWLDELMTELGATAIRRGRQ